MRFITVKTARLLQWVGFKLVLLGIDVQLYQMAIDTKKRKNTTESNVSK